MTYRLTQEELDQQFEQFLKEVSIFAVAEVIFTFSGISPLCY